VLPPDIAPTAVLSIVKVLALGVTNPDVNVKTPLAPMLTFPDNVFSPPPEIVMLF
jgi:hypothetical protein